jgi:hypothetical protein
MLSVAIIAFHPITLRAAVSPQYQMLPPTYIGTSSSVKAVPCDPVGQQLIYSGTNSDPSQFPNNDPNGPTAAINCAGSHGNNPGPFVTMTGPNAGFLGLGTSLPAVALDVVGQENITGPILVGANNISGTGLYINGGNGAGGGYITLGNIMGDNDMNFNGGSDGSFWFVNSSPLATGGTNFASSNFSGTNFWIGNNGNVGIGTMSPVATLDVNGEVKLSSNSQTCDSNHGGTMRYNSSSKTLEYCNETKWVSASPTGVFGNPSCGGAACYTDGATRNKVCQDNGYNSAQSAGTSYGDHNGSGIYRWGGFWQSMSGCDSCGHIIVVVCQ